MNVNTLLVLSFIFGSWFGQVNTPVTNIAYGVWLAVLVFWSIISFQFFWFADKKYKIRNIKKYNIEFISTIVFLNLLFAINLLLCREYWLFALCCISVFLPIAEMVYMKFLLEEKRKHR